MSLVQGVSNYSKAQLKYCDPWQCSPNPCYTFEFENYTPCELVWLASYSGCPENPGTSIPPAPIPPPIAPTKGSWVAPCMKCNDNGTCGCPLIIRLFNQATQNYVDDWGEIGTWNWPNSEITYRHIPFQGCCFSQEIKVTIKLTGLNSAKITVVCDN